MMNFPDRSKTMSGSVWVLELCKDLVPNTVPLLGRISAALCDCSSLGFSCDL